VLFLTGRQKRFDRFAHSKALFAHSKALFANWTKKTRPAISIYPGDRCNLIGE
jgi:hypothetical protein